MSPLIAVYKGHVHRGYIYIYIYIHLSDGSAPTESKDLGPHEMYGESVAPWPAGNVGG